MENLLHLFDKEIIRESLPKNLVLVEIGSDRYYSKNSQIMTVVKKGNNMGVGIVQEGNFDALLNEGSAAYGAFANSSAVRKLFLI